jgi:hypothetical protein
MPVLAIGNGESRAGLDLTQILKTNISVGCNAISRDYAVDHLVCCDRRMVKEAITVGIPVHSIYTRPEWVSEFKYSSWVKTVPELPYQGDTRPDEPFQWGSGPYAILLAAELAVDEVWLIGFDLYGDGNKVNNVYKGTENYVKESHHAIDPSYWIHQTAKVFEHFPHIKFTVFNLDGWQLPPQWQFDNVVVDKLPLNF